MIIKDGPSPYKHGKIPVCMLRYYPLLDDIYGESEVESVLPLQRAINALVCGFLDECNIKMRPPLKISASGVRIETIEFGPSAKWIMSSPAAVQELEPNGGFVTAFNAAYPMLLAAFNTAMGDMSIGVSNLPPFSTEKTATEVVSMERQQTSRDQYNQLYLSEFLKDIMMMWVANNKQYLFDEASGRKYYILKIVGKENISGLAMLGLGGKEIPNSAIRQIGDIVSQNPSFVSDKMIEDILGEVSVPLHPVEVKKGEIKPKLDIKENQVEADLYITPEDMTGEFDYIPDVKSMAAGSSVILSQARQRAMEYVLNPTILSLLQIEGHKVKIKELLTTVLEDAGYRDAESLFEPIRKEDEEAIQSVGQNAEEVGVSGGIGAGNIPPLLAGPNGGGEAVGEIGRTGRPKPPRPRGGNGQAAFGTGIGASGVNGNEGVAGVS